MTQVTPTLGVKMSEQRAKSYIDELNKKVLERWQERVTQGPFMSRFLEGTLPMSAIRLLRSAADIGVGSARMTVGLDVFNALNASTVLTYNNTFVPGGTWLQPLTILSPRFIRLTGEVDF